MERIGYPNSDYKFDQLELESPQAMQGGGAYFAKITQGKDQAVVQFPQCTTKSGIVSTKRSTYLDLMYDRNDHLDIVGWSESLVNRVSVLIDQKKALWFSNDLTSDDIENMFSSLHRDFKSGSKILIRATIETSRGSGDLKCKVYDEDEKIILDRAVIDSRSTKAIIPLVLVDGVKFTARSIEIELKVKQMMLLNEERPQSPACMIKRENDKIDIKALPITTDDDDSLVNLDHIDDASLVADQVADVVVETRPDGELEEVSVELQEDLSELESGSDGASEETRTSTAVSENDGSEDNANGLEEVTLGDLSDFPEPDKDKDIAEDAIAEVEIELSGDGHAMKLKKPNEVYYEIYKAAKLKAKQMRRAAVEAYLEAKQIKTKYMLDDLDDSDEEEIEVENLSS